MKHVIVIPMMSLLLLPYVLAETMASACGQSSPPKPAAESAAPTLKIGDQTPHLHADRWFNGQPVSNYSRRNFYVIEFWETGCDPCLKSLPHLNELASKYEKDGLVVIALTAAGEANTSEDVETFVKKDGSKYSIRFAFSNGRTNHTNFIEASGQNELATCFVVDREGKIAFIGMPQDLGYVIERMVQGKWRGQQDAEELKQLNESISGLGLLAQSDPQKAFELIQHVHKANPERTKSFDFRYSEVVTLTRMKMFNEAQAVIAMAIAAEPEPGEWGQIALLCGSLASPAVNSEGVQREYALKQMAEAEQRLQGDWQSLFQVGMAYQMAGEQKKFEACLRNVAENCPDPETKAGFQTLMKLSSPPKPSAGK